MSSPLETLRALSRSARPEYERNENNEITPPQNEKPSVIPPIEGLNSFNSFLSSPRSTDDIEERAAIIEEGAGVPRAWAEGFAALTSMPVPAGFSPERWQRIVDAAGVFLDRWASEAIRCGWTDLDVFGCNPDRPDARFDAMGLVLLLDRCEIVSIDGNGADLVTGTGARQRYRRRPLPADTLALWDLGVAGRNAG